MRRALDPRISNVAIDANSVDRPDPARAAAVDRLLGLYEAEKVRLIVPKGVRIEFQHGRTPDGSCEGRRPVTDFHVTSWPECGGATQAP